MAIFAPPLRTSLQMVRDAREDIDRVTRQDVRSAGWDGGGDLSSGADTTATVGYLLDYSGNAAQFETLYHKGAELPRQPNFATVSTAETTTSTSYTDLATSGPAVTVTSGTSILIVITSILINNTAGERMFVGYDLSGATTQSAADGKALILRSNSADTAFEGSMSYVILETVTAGTNTVTLKYRTTGGTFDARFRRLTVLSF